MLKVILYILFLTNIIAAQNYWSTKFEKSNYLSTSDYKTTIEYFKKLADSSVYAQLINIGISPQGREIKCLIVSKNKIFTPLEAQNSDDAIILINNGIHSGEIEGKDASMLMLREMLITKKKSKLIDNVILLVIPIFNVDGHERSSPYGRINQNGPAEMGWRTTAQNFNLNRDFTKADAPEMKAFLKLFNEWLPDIFIDNHTTNGADYQYTITYAISKHLDVPPATRKIVIDEIIPRIESDVNKAGYLISPFVGFIEKNYNNGIRDWVASPRFSNGYASVQNRIGLLIETHMLKSYKDRVFSTKALMESVLNYCSEYHYQLNEISKLADQYVIDRYSVNKHGYPIDFTITSDSVEFNYKGYQRIFNESRIAGKPVVNYTNTKTEKVVPYYNNTEVTDSVLLPSAYIIPREWSHLAENMKIHGIEIDTIKEFQEAIIEKYKFSNISFANRPYEGRFIPSYDYDVLIDTITITPGDYIVRTNQRSLGMIVHLLEPKAADSFVKWGFMNIIFERKEYFEEYSMEPVAQKMYNNFEELRYEFNNLIESDSSFANSPAKRLNFFYKRSPYYDQKHNVYPILRIINQ